MINMKDRDDKAKKKILFVSFALFFGAKMCVLCMFYVD